MVVYIACQPILLKEIGSKEESLTVIEPSNLPITENSVKNPRWGELAA